MHGVSAMGNGYCRARADLRGMGVKHLSPKFYVLARKIVEATPQL